MPIYLQFNYRSELISKPYIPFNHLLVNNSNGIYTSNTDKRSKVMCITLHGSPGIGDLTKYD